MHSAKSPDGFFAAATTIAPVSQIIEKEIVRLCGQTLRGVYTDRGKAKKKPKNQKKPKIQKNQKRAFLGFMSQLNSDSPDSSGHFRL